MRVVTLKRADEIQEGDIISSLGLMPSYHQVTITKIKKIKSGRYLTRKHNNEDHTRFFYNDEEFVYEGIHMKGTD